jgi:general secretion pathway protein C
MEALLRKHFWALDFLVAGVCAVFLARATASLAESQMVGNMPPRAPSSGSFSGVTPDAPSKEVKPILDRNIFCSDCPPFDPPKVDNVVAGVSGGAESASPPQKTTMPIGIMAIMYAPPPAGIKYSIAVLYLNEGPGIGAFSVGSKILDAVVTDIEPTRVWFDNKGRTEFIDLIEEEKSETAVAKVEDSGEKPKAGDALAEELDRGLKKTGENSYDLQRRTLEQVLGNMSLLSRSARIVPELRDGKPAGFRLYSVRSEGPFAKIGLQNGDVIYSINGLEMSSPEKALEVYSKLKSARHLSLGLERSGTKVTKEYTIR